ncbi:MAG: sister chromatid cohesion protein PDS5 [Mollicutes bacterium]|nr:sister chromatid cohesion protein PDS5 [Mollicutes bacterium]
MSEKNGQIRPDLSKEELFEILSSDENQVKRLQAFYTLGVDNGVKAFKHYFLSQSDAAQIVSKELRDSIDGDYNTEPLLQNLYKSLITWQLSKTKLFGDDEKMTYEQKRDYYLYKFPD